MKSICCLSLMFVVCLVAVGRLSAQEDQAAKRKATQKKMAEAAEKSFQAMDKNQDGLLTFEEYAKRRKKAEAQAKAEEIFKLIDADGDHKVSLKEFQHKPPEARFRQMDANNDGKLVFAEFKGRRENPDQLERAEQNFKRLDADGNEEVTLKEFKAAQQQRGKKAGGRHRAKK